MGSITRRMVGIILLTVCNIILPAPQPLQTIVAATALTRSVPSSELLPRPVRTALGARAQQMIKNGGIGENKSAIATVLVRGSETSSADVVDIVDVGSSSGSRVDGVARGSGDDAVACGSPQEPVYPRDLFTAEQCSRGAIALHIAGILYALVGLALVCDEFFIPALEELSFTRLGLSPDVAGATLMAAGTSFPELATNFVGTFAGSPMIGFGSIVGSAMFNVVFITAACALWSGHLSDQMRSFKPYPIIRDTVWYILLLGILALVLLYWTPGVIEWWESLMLLTAYALYVVQMKLDARIRTTAESLLGYYHDGRMGPTDGKKGATGDDDGLKYSTNSPDCPTHVANDITYSSGLGSKAPPVNDLLLASEVTSIHDIDNENNISNTISSSNYHNGEHIKRSLLFCQKNKQPVDHGIHRSCDSIVGSHDAGTHGVTNTAAGAAADAIHNNVEAASRHTDMTGASIHRTSRSTVSSIYIGDCHEPLSSDDGYADTITSTHKTLLDLQSYSRTPIYQHITSPLFDDHDIDDYIAMNDEYTHYPSIFLMCDNQRQAGMREPTAYPGYYRVGIFQLMTGLISLESVIETHAIDRIRGKLHTLFHRRLMANGETSSSSSDGTKMMKTREVERMLDELLLQHTDPITSQILRKSIRDCLCVLDQGGGVIDFNALEQWLIQSDMRFVDEVGRVFDVLDTDNDGEISCTEATFVLSVTGHPYPEIHPPATSSNVSGPPESADRQDYAIHVVMSSDDMSLLNTPLLETAPHSSSKAVNADAATGRITKARFIEWYRNAHEIIEGKRQATKQAILSTRESRAIGMLHWPDTVMGRVVFVFIIPLMTLFVLTIPNVQRKTRDVGIMFLLLSFFMSILWVGVLSYFVVWWATTAGHVFAIPDVIMGVTFIAIGTSIPEMITSVMVAKKGEVSMALGSLFGSNVFNIAVGLAAPWATYTAVTPENNVAFNAKDTGGGTSIVFLLVMQFLLVFFFFPVFGWKLTRGLGYALLLFYVSLIGADLYIYYNYSF